MRKLQILFEIKCYRILHFSFFLILFLFNNLLSQEFQSLPLQSTVDRVQPMTGIVFWADNENALSKLNDVVQLEFSYLVYGDVVSQKGIYNWALIDTLLAKAARNKRQLVLRFRYVYPGSIRPSVPLYIRNIPAFKDTIQKIEGLDTYIPDWSSKELQKFTLEFFTKFAERYDNSRSLAFLQIGFGSYAEFHLFEYENELSLGQVFPSKKFQTKFLKHLDSVFKKTKWSISIDAAQEKYSPFSKDRNLIKLDFGLFDDSFLHKKHSKNDKEYNRANWLFFGRRKFERNVNGGEFSYYEEHDQEYALRVPKGPWGIRFEDLAKRYNLTYIIGNDQLKYAKKERIKEAGKNLGYHFEATSFQSNGVITKVTIHNKGIAPIYYDAFPSIGEIRSSASLRGLLPGKSRSFILNTAASNGKLKIVCDRLVAGQVIQYDADL